MKSLIYLCVLTVFLTGCASDKPVSDKELSAAMLSAQADLDRDRQRRESKAQSKRSAARKVAYKAEVESLAQADRNAEIQRQSTAERAKQVAELERKTRLENEYRAKVRAAKAKAEADRLAEAKEKARIKALDSMVSLRNFYKIESGMSRRQVVALLGSEGEMLSEVAIPGFPTTRIFMWKAPGLFSGNCNVTFQNGKVTVKAQFGLK